MTLIERCEPRRLLSVTLQHETLLIYTGDGVDNIEFRQLNSTTLRLTVNDETFDFAYDSVARCEIKTNAGGDRIVLGPRVKFRATIDGGKGNDSITGGQANDSILGSGGDDLLVGRGGNDTLIGGISSDQLLGSDGDDTLIPYSQSYYDDTVNGGAGIDIADYSTETKNLTIYVGGAEGSVAWTDKIGSDIEILKAGSGHDLLVNERSAPMTIFGSDGNDTIRAGPFGDLIYLGSGADHVTGHSGNDHFVLEIADGRVDRINGKHGADVIDDPENLEAGDIVTNV